MKARYFRKGKTIRDIETVDTNYHSINEAKRKSRELQGRLGDGSLSVVTKLPSFPTKEES